MHCNAWQSNALKHNTAHYNELVLHCTTFQSKAMQGSAVERARCDASPPCQSPVLIRLKQLCSRNLRKTLPRVTVHPKSSPCIVDLQKDKYKDKDTQTQTKTNTKCFQDPIYAIFSISRGFKDLQYYIGCLFVMTQTQTKPQFFMH